MNRYSNRRCGRPTNDELRNPPAIAPVAARVAKTWARTPVVESGQYSSRVRRAVTAHADELAGLIGSGARLAHVGLALAEAGVTDRRGKPIDPGAFAIVWRRVEALRPRLPRRQA